MTTCTECLTALSTMRLAEIRRGSPIEQHYSTCENCSRVAADLQYAERKLALALSELGSSMPPSVIAEEAITGAAKLRRRNAAKWFRRGLFAFGALILGTYVMENRNSGTSGSEMTTEMVIPKCTAPEEAIAVVTPYLRSSGSAVYSGKNAKFITLRGAHREVENAISRLDEYEARVCTLPVSTAVVTTPGALGKTYLESQVDKPAAPIPGAAEPHYPDALRASGIEGEVQAEFVVDESGKPDKTTFRVLKSTNGQFEGTVRSALPLMRFDAAEIAGRKVRQVVNRTFEFKLDR